MEKSKKRQKVAILVVVSVIVLILIAGLIGGLIYWGHSRKATSYSEAEHIERISELVEKRYMGNNSAFSDFNVYPLYDENDNFAYYCVVEFEPYGYVYVKIWDKGIGHGMYSRCSLDTNTQWERYRICKDGKTPLPYNGNQWINATNNKGLIMNEEIYYESKDGEIITYFESHFKVANIDRTTRRYLLNIVGGQIPAVKLGNNFLNLISMEKFEYKSNLSINEYPYTLQHPLPKKICDL